MKGDPEQRALLLGEYIVEHGATVRAAARAFGCSKSTVHKDVSVRLRTVGPELFRQVQMIDGFELTEPNARGCVPEILREAGFREVEEVKIIQTPTGSISLYRGRR